MTTLRQIIYAKDGSQDAINWCNEMFPDEPEKGIRWWWWRVSDNTLGAGDRHRFFFTREEDHFKFMLAFSDIIKEYR